MVSAIIVSAGKGIRMQNPLRKQYLLLAGEPILIHTLKAFDFCNLIDEIILVIPENDFEYCRREILFFHKFRLTVKLVPGGKKRQDSVYNGLIAINGASADSIVVVHDGVRPFVDSDQLIKSIVCTKNTGSCILAIPVVDTIKKVNSSFLIEKTYKRKNIWLSQTPQTFNYFLLKKAHESAKLSGYYGTDDASLLERTGVNVKVINGSRYNIKITTKEDLMFAEGLLLK